MGSITRITTLPAFHKHKHTLIKLIPKYLKKSKCTDTPDDILKDIEFNCHNPYFFACLVNDNGFVVALVQPSLTGKKTIIEHFYVSNSIAAPVYKAIITKLEEQFKINETIWATYRNPDAWMRFAKKQGIDLTIKSYLLSERR